MIHVLFLSTCGLLTYWNNSLSNSNSLTLFKMSDFIPVINNRRNGSGRARMPIRPAIVPCCRHCENLGLSSDHWLRSRNGETTCPVLLANKCSYCHLPGHTLKLCAELKAKNERYQARTSVQAPASVQAPVSVQATNAVQPADTFQPSSWVRHSTSWARYSTSSTLSLIHPDTISSNEYDLHEEMEDDAPFQIEITDVIPRDTPYVSQTSIKYASRNWADMSDSDEE